MTSWKHYGKGGMNNAYISEDGTQMMKIQRNSAQSDSPERSARLWNEINPGVQLPAYCHKEEGFPLGWVCPFIKGEQATDEEMCKAVIDIYNRTGRIVIDAMMPGNFLRTPQGQVVCVDVGMALQFEAGEGMSSSVNRRQSIISSATLEEMGGKMGIAQWNYESGNSDKAPKTYKAIEALQFILEVRPDIHDVSFLISDSSTGPKLDEVFAACGSNKSRLYEDKYNDIMSKFSEVQPIMSALSKTKPINFEALKQSCIDELKLYINARGKVDFFGNFTPSLKTKILKNEALTHKKVASAQDLIEKISNADSVEDVRALLESVKADTTLYSNRLKMCIDMLDHIFEKPAIQTNVAR